MPMDPQIEDRKVETQEVTISTNGTLSTATTDLSSRTVVGLQITSWGTSASLTFDVSYDASDFSPLIDKDGEYTITDPNAVNSGDVQIALDPSVFAGVRSLKVRSGTAGSTTQQTAGATIKVITRGVA